MHRGLDAVIAGKTKAAVAAANAAPAAPAIPFVFTTTLLTPISGFSRAKEHLDSFAAAAAEMGYSELTIAGLLGHTVASVTGRYAHVPDRALVSAADAVAARIAAGLDGRGEAELIHLRAGT